MKLFLFISPFVSFGINIYEHDLFDAARNQTSNGKCLLEFFEKMIKRSSMEYVRIALEILSNESIFPKIMN